MHTEAEQRLRSRVAVQTAGGRRHFLDTRCVQLDTGRQAFVIFRLASRDVRCIGCREGFLRSGHHRSRPGTKPSREIIPAEVLNSGPRNERQRWTFVSCCRHESTCNRKQQGKFHDQAQLKPLFASPEEHCIRILTGPPARLLAET